MAKPQVKPLEKFTVAARDRYEKGRVQIFNGYDHAVEVVIKRARKK